MKCIKCDNELEVNAKLCGKCGAEQIKSPVKSKETKGGQKSFKLDMSKEGNRRSLMGIGFLILLKLLGPLVGSYLLAGIILGVLFAIIDYLFKKSLTETGKIDKIESLKEKNNIVEIKQVEKKESVNYKKYAKYIPYAVIIILVIVIIFLINNKTTSIQNKEYEQSSNSLKSSSKFISDEDFNKISEDDWNNVANIDKYGAEVLQIGGVGSRINQATAYLLNEHGYLNPPEDWVNTSFNIPADLMWISCRSEYIISACATENSYIIDDVFGCGISIVDQMKNSAVINCIKK